jgi:glycosyltransferase involved in cell wall biosynthesis
MSTVPSLSVLFISRDGLQDFDHQREYFKRQLGWSIRHYQSGRHPFAKTTDSISLISARGGAWRDPAHFAMLSSAPVIPAPGPALKALQDSADLIVCELETGLLPILSESRCTIIGTVSYFERRQLADSLGGAVTTVGANKPDNTLLHGHLKHCDCILAPSNWHREQLPTAMQARCIVVEPSVDLGFWAPESAHSRVWKNELVPRNLKIVTYACQGNDEDGEWPAFLHAAVRLTYCRSDLRIFCVRSPLLGRDNWHCGEMNRTQLMMDYEFDLTQMEFPGLLSPKLMRRLLNISDVYVHLNGDFIGDYLLQAAATGCPILARDSVQTRRVLKATRTFPLFPIQTHRV